MSTAIDAALISRVSIINRTRPSTTPTSPAFLVSRRLATHRFSGHRLSDARRRNLIVVASSLPPFGELDPFAEPRRQLSKKSVILNLVQEIEPLDVSLIQKDVPANTVDAMKRTISGMLGLLPSGQFHVQVEAFWGPLSKLLISSMKTGYTLRNAEFRLCLERNLDVHEHEELSEDGRLENVGDGNNETSDVRSPTMLNVSNASDILHDNGKNEGEAFYYPDGIDGLGELTPKVQEYILNLQSRLDSMEKELHEIKRKSSALSMQQFVGEEQNDLLDYLRSLQPEKVAELSQLTCPGVDETIHSVVYGLLATLSPRVHSKPHPHLGNATGGSLGTGKDDCAELVENTSIQFQPLISVPRDYLARLLFWCMLLGHYIRGLEYRLDLMELLSLSGDF